MANLISKKVLFTTAFLAKLIFSILFTIACFFIQSDVINQDMEDVIEICGGEDWYTIGKRNWDEESSEWVGYVPWDEKVVNCIHHTRSGLIIAGAVFLFVSIILEAKTLLKNNCKWPLFMTLIQSLGSVLIVAATVSDYLNTMFTTRKVFRAHGYEAIFLKGYTGLSRTMWIVGFSLLLYGQIYTLLHHKRIGVTVISTYIVAGIGSILLLAAGTLRRGQFGGGVFFGYNGTIINETFHFDDQIITDIFAVMLSGSVFFIAHAIMFFFFLYNEAVLISEEKDLSHEEIMEEGQNPNSSLDIHQEDKKVEVNAF